MFYMGGSVQNLNLNKIFEKHKNISPAVLLTVYNVFQGILPSLLLCFYFTINWLLRSGLYPSNIDPITLASLLITVQRDKVPLWLLH